MGATGEGPEMLDYRAGRYNWGATVREAAAAANEVAGERVADVISAGLDDTVSFDSGLAVVADSSESPTELIESGGVAEARNEAVLRERAAYHQTVGYRQERRASRRKMKRAQRVYGKKYYLTKTQVVLGLLVWAGTVLIVGSLLAGFWMGLASQTGVCG